MGSLVKLGSLGCNDSLVVYRHAHVPRFARIFGTRDLAARSRFTVRSSCNGSLALHGTRIPNGSLLKNGTLLLVGSLSHSGTHTKYRLAKV